MIHLEAMEAAALWDGGAILNNRFSPPFTGLVHSPPQKRAEFPTVPTASATGYRFVLKRVSQDLFL